MKNMLLAPAVLTASALALAGCSSSSADGVASSAPAADDAALTVAAAMYPLEFVATEVGGDLVEIVSVTPPGVEPHDVELSPAAVRALGDADLALYLAGFAPAVDDAISTTGVDAIAVGDVVELAPGVAHDHADEAGDDHADEAGDDHGATDPHFWLDPHLLAEYGEAVAERLGELDPANAATYTANAESLHASMEELEESYSTGLAQCERDTIVTSHEAFGYLTAAFGLHQEGIAGLDPENEPSPARLLEIKEIIAETGATTVFAEDAVSSTVAEALAEDVGVETAVLSPVETVADGDDYIAVMTRNLETLRTALGCA